MQLLASASVLSTSASLECEVHSFPCNVTPLACACRFVCPVTSRHLMSSCYRLSGSSVGQLHLCCQACFPVPQGSTIHVTYPAVFVLQAVLA